MMFAQAARLSSTRALLIEAASSSEAAVTKMIINSPATVFPNQDPLKKESSSCVKHTTGVL